MSRIGSRTVWFVVSALWLSGSGCTSLREIPRSEFGAQPERKDVRVVTHDGLVYEFDVAKVQGDSLLGYRRRDVEGAVDEFATVRMALDDVDHLEGRGLDWYRTGLIGGGVALAVIVGGLSVSRNSNNGDPSSGGGKTPPPAAHPAR